MNGFDLYEKRVIEARDRFGCSATVRTIFSDDTPEDLLLAFLIEFAARGVAITEPVDRWIWSAGERCQAIGLDEVGRALMRHAVHEAGHDRYHVADCEVLVRIWNDGGRAKLVAPELLQRPIGGAARAYVRLHEDVLESPTPYRQVAIEREIEGLSVSSGDGFVNLVRSRLGSGISGVMTFVNSHVELDRGHTAFNDRLLRTLLDQRPDALEPLIETGTRALELYEAYLAECLDSARGLVGSRAACSGAESSVAGRVRPTGD